MRTTKRLLVPLLALGFAAAAAALPPDLQKLKPKNFPERPIQINVAYPAGGGNDVTSRAVAANAEKYLGVRVVVVNHPGGGGRIGYTWLAHEADKHGYDVGLANPDTFAVGSMNVNPHDFEPIDFILYTPLVMTVNTSSDIGKMSREAFFKYLEDPSHTLRVGVVPNSTFVYLAKDLARHVKAHISIVNFQGGHPGVVALLGNHIDATLAFVGEFKQYVDAGQLKAVAVAGNSRYSVLPDVPTFKEMGVPVGQWGSARYLVVPKGVPADRLRFLSAGLLAAIKDPQTVEALAKDGSPVSAPLGHEAARKQFFETYDETLRFRKKYAQ